MCGSSTADSVAGYKNGKPNIAPLQPPTLATFRSWGSSAGAGRADLPGGKDTRVVGIIKQETKNKWAYHFAGWFYLMN
jgi:hypothetical protein